VRQRVVQRGRRAVIMEARLSYPEHRRRFPARPPRPPRRRPDQGRQRV